MEQLPLPEMTLDARPLLQKHSMVSSSRNEENLLNMASLENVLLQDEEGGLLSEEDDLPLCPKVLSRTETMDSMEHIDFGHSRRRRSQQEDAHPRRAPPRTGTMDSMDRILLQSAAQEVGQEHLSAPPKRRSVRGGRKNKRRPTTTTTADGDEQNDSQ